MEQAREPRPPPPGESVGRRPIVGRFGAVALLALASVLACAYALQWERSIGRSDDDRLDRQVEEAQALLADRFRDYENALLAERAHLQAADGEVSYADFATFTEAMSLDERYEGLQGMKFHAVVPGDQLDEFVERARADGRPDFTATPPGERDEYFIAQYDEPADTRSATWGVDARTDPTDREVLERARDSGEFTLSGETVLGEDRTLPADEQPAAFELFLPVYRPGAPISTVTERRSASLGWASSPFRVQDFVTSVAGRSTLGVEVFDGEMSEDQRIAAAPAAFRARGDMTRTTSLDLGGRRWVLRFAPLPPGSATSSRAGPLSVAIGAIGGIVVLLAALAVFAAERVRVAKIHAHQALHDPLTGLPNRALLIDRCTQMLALAKRRDGMVAAYYVDLDAFKLVNVDHGHAGGDAVLIAVGERLLATVRPSDTVARLGGDEYVVLCDGLKTTEEAGALTDRIAQALAAPISYLGEGLTVTASVGMAIAEPDQQPEGLLRDADTVMHRAKSDRATAHS
jgi:diguanylate cyclase (GGDEF)-like protein